MAAAARLVGSAGDGGVGRDLLSGSAPTDCLKADSSCVAMEWRAESCQFRMA